MRFILVVQVIAASVFSCVASRNKQKNNPAPGYRTSSSGALNSGVGSEGSVWSASANGTYGVYLRFVMNAAQPGNSTHRAGGFLLRCLSE